MATTVRAALSVLMLAGFYVLAVGLVVVLGVLSVVSFDADMVGAGGNLAITAVIAAVALGAALWKVARAKPEPPEGLLLTRQDAPELWALVDDLAEQAGTRGPDDIRLVPDVNAAVSEDARWLGLVAGPRHLYLGVPLLMGLDVGQLTSVLAHEFGHYAHSHTRLSVVAYRGREAIAASLEQLSGNIVGWFLRQYAKVYVLVSARVTRQQEVEADELSVRIAGREVAQDALRELPVIDAVWDFYVEQYLDPVWDIGLAPTAPGFFGGFAELVRARDGELAELRASEPPSEVSVWDTHPSIGARIVAMEHMSESRAARRDTRRATDLVPDLIDVATRLVEEVVTFGERTRLPWDEATAAGMAHASQRTADSVYRAVARFAGQPRATLGTVLDLVADGRGPELFRRLGGDVLAGDVTIDVAPRDAVVDHDAAPGEPVASEPAWAFDDVVHNLVAAAAVRAGVARWQHSWSGAAALVDAAGAELSLTELVEAATAEATVAAARDRLVEMGIDVGAVGAVGERATAHGADVLGGLATVKVDGVPHDVFVLDLGMVLVRCPKSSDGGKARMLSLLESASPAELAQAHRYVPFEDLATATVHRTIPLKVDVVLHDGQRLSFKEPWTSEQLTSDSAEMLAGLILESVRLAEQVA